MGICCLDQLALHRPQITTSVVLKILFLCDNCCIASHDMPCRGRDRKRATRSDNRGSESGGGPPGVNGCESNAAGIDVRQLSFKRIGVMLPQ